MTWADPDVVLPDTTPTVIDYLRAIPALTAEVADRVYIAVPAKPTWPAIRVNELTSLVVAHHRLDRVLYQFDCFAPTPAPARRLGALVRSALMDCGGFASRGAVLTGADDISSRIDADDSFGGPVYRAAVTAHIYARPNP